MKTSAVGVGGIDEGFNDSQGMENLLCSGIHVIETATGGGGGIGGGSGRRTGGGGGGGRGGGGGGGGGGRCGSFGVYGDIHRGSYRVYSFSSL